METNSLKGREGEVAIVEAELKELQKELVSIAKEIKDCKDSSTRKALFGDKKMIQADIEEAKKHLSVLKGEDVSMPSEELDTLLSENQNNNENETTNTDGNSN